MSPLSDEYIRSLEPETLRYDVTIFDDFVISVLPNGIKTWAFLYDYEGRKRRKTLGVYPDMSYAQAEDALDNVRGMIAKLGGDIKDSAVEDDMPVVTVPEQAKAPLKPEQRPAVLAGGLRKRRTKRKRKPIRLPMRWVKRIAIGVLAVGAVAAIALIVPRLDLFSGSSDTPASPTVTDSASAPQRARPEPIVLGGEPAGSQSRPAPSGSGTTPGRAAPKPIILEKPAPTKPPQPAPQGSATDATPKTTASATPPAPAASTGPAPNTVVPAARDAGASANDAAPARTGAIAPGRSLPIADKSDPPRAAATTEPTNTGAARPAPSPTAAPAVTPPITTQATDATATGGEVTRAIVTSNVIDLEPVDDLGQSVTLDNGGYQTVFYFTELRNFTAGQIVHRWVHNERIIADVPLRVGGGWRWRTYSSKDLLPGLTGDWRVEVIDGNGRILGQRQFRFDR